MQWKHRKRLSSEEAPPEQNLNGGTFPIYINSGNEETQQISPIRVVENRLFFYGEIDEMMCLEVNRLLLELDLKFQNQKNRSGDDEYSPILHLHLNTIGGCIFSAFSTVDTIRNLKSKVYTHVDGLVASAGTLISAIGEKRFIGRHAHMMIHQLSSETYGKFSDMETDMENCARLMKVLKDFYKKNTKIPMKKLDMLMKQDIYMDADECLACGIVDEIK